MLMASPTSPKCHERGSPAPTQGRVVKRALPSLPTYPDKISRFSIPHACTVSPHTPNEADTFVILQLIHCIFCCISDLARCAHVVTHCVVARS